jgi:hypothetical protein
MRLLFVGGLFGLLAPACISAPEAPESSEDPEEVGVDQAPIEGADNYGADCDATTKTFLDKVMLYGRAASASRAFTQCMSNAMTSMVSLGGQSFGPYRKCNGDPFYASPAATQLTNVLAMTHSTADILINCTGGGGNASTYLGAYGINDPEQLNFSGWLASVVASLAWPVCNGSNGPSCRAAAAPWPYSQAAGIIWHEQSHTQGYTHGANDQANALINCGYPGDPTWNFQFNTMPYIDGDCISAVIDQSGTTCGNLDSCGPGRVKLIDGIGSSTCTCVPDPRGCLGSTSYVTTVVSTAANTSAGRVLIDNPYSNGLPSASVTATSVWWTPGQAGGVYNNHPIGVKYDSAAGKWAIFNEDGGAMPLGAEFNVEIDPSNVVTATAGNIGGDWMIINDLRINNNPDATVIVTPNMTPNGSGSMTEPHALGVFYSAPYWRVYNQDLAAIQVGQSFNVRIDTCAQAVTANATNVLSDFMTFSHPLADGNPSALVFATPNWNPDGRSGVYDTHPIGVYFDPGQNKWTVYHQDLSAIPLGASYNIRVHSRGTFTPTASMQGYNAASSLQYSSGPNCFGSSNDYGPWQVCPNGSHIAAVTCRMAPGSQGSCSVTNQTATTAGLHVVANSNCFSGAQATLVPTCIAN